MLEVVDDVLRLAVNEGCIVWVCGEMSLSSDDTSVVMMGVEVTDL